MQRPLRPCLTYGCKRLVLKGYCDYHQKQYKNSYKYDRISSRKRGYDCIWEKFRKVYLRQNPLCIRCGRPANLIHHRKPLPHGKKYAENNLQALCVGCHAEAHKELRYQ